jgi:hypothetical protein
VKRPCHVCGTPTHGRVPTAPLMLELPRCPQCAARVEAKRIEAEAARRQRDDSTPRGAE